MIRLSLSGRLFESADGYRLSRMAFLDFARTAGFDGVELRYPQLPVETPEDEVVGVKRALRARGLAWLYGTIEGLESDEAYRRAAATMRQHVLGAARFTRVTVFEADQVPRAQRLADEARAMDHSLIIQLHAGTLADTPSRALDLLGMVGRPNVGLAFDASHLRFAGDEDVAGAIDALAPHLRVVCIQSYKPAPPGAAAGDVVRVNDRPFVRALPGDPGGVDLERLFDGLRSIGFKGDALVMCDAPPGVDPQRLAGDWFTRLDRLRTEA